MRGWSVTDTTIWGCHVNYVKVRRALIRKYSVHTHTHTHYSCFHDTCRHHYEIIIHRHTYSSGFHCNYLNVLPCLPGSRGFRSNCVHEVFPAPTSREVS